MREDTELWREKGAEEEREKVSVEKEIQEMQQRKVVAEEEKRRYLSRDPFPSTYQLNLQSTIYTGVLKGWRGQTAHCRAVR